MVKKFKVTTKRKIIFLVGALCIIFVIALLNLRNYVFTQCVEHVDHSKTHTHAQLKIFQDGRSIKIPANIGIVEGCMHPLHTHDTTGLIHMEFPFPFMFTLGDFFDVMGTKFSDSQIGAIQTFDKYTITVRKNGKLIPSYYRFILLRDLDKIEIRIDEKKT